MSKKAIVVVELNVHDDASVAATEIALAIRRIRSIKTIHMTNDIIIGLDEIAESVVDYLRGAERDGQG